MARRDDPRRVPLLGFLVFTIGAATLIGLFVVTTDESWGEEAVTLTAHFNSVSGLKKNSHVLLSGKKVGRVEEVAIVTTRYSCDPLTEDAGAGGTRTDFCDRSLFCAPTPDGGGLCAELVPFTGLASDYEGKGCASDASEVHTRIEASPGDCSASEVCLSDEFRRRNQGLEWPGPRDVCVSYATELRRVEVRMSVAADELAFVRSDSRATIASKGVLGDQQVNITVGSADPLPPGGRLQTSPTLLEQLGRFRERIGAITGRVSATFSGRLRDRPRGEVEPRVDRRTQLARFREATDDLLAGRGQMGELFEPRSRDELSGDLQDLRRSSDKIGRDLAGWRQETVPDIRSSARELDDVAEVAHLATDGKPDNMATRLVTDERMGTELADGIDGASQRIADARDSAVELQKDVNELRGQIERGEGPLGELLRSPRLYYEFVKAIALFDMFDRNDSFKSLARDVIRSGDARRRPGQRDRR